VPPTGGRHEGGSMKKIKVKIRKLEKIETTGERDTFG
jgi:hypothetical protein